MILAKDIARYSGLLLGGGLIGSSIYYVPDGHVAILQQISADGRPKEENSRILRQAGIKFHKPFIESVSVINVHPVDRILTLETKTKDSESVRVSLRVKVEPNQEQLLELNGFGETNVTDKILPIVGAQAVHEVIGASQSCEVLEESDRIEQLLYARISSYANEYHLIVDEITCQPFSFSAAFLRKEIGKRDWQLEDKLSKAALSGAKTNTSSNENDILH